jgi:hypothetical protein
MSIKYVIMAVFIFVILHLALIPLGNTTLNDTMADKLNNVAYFGIPTEETDVGLLEYVKAPYNYFSSLAYIMTSGVRDNPIFSSEFQMVGWLVLAPIIAGWVFGLVMVFWSIWQH